VLFYICIFIPYVILRLFEKITEFVELRDILELHLLFFDFKLFIVFLKVLYFHILIIYFFLKKFFFLDSKIL